MFNRLKKDIGGATAIEYALLAAMMAIAAIAGLTMLGSGTNSMWGRVGTAFNTHIK